MKEPYSEILARYIAPESCMHIGNGVYEALTGVHVGQVLNRERNTNFGVPTLSGCAEIGTSICQWVSIIFTRVTDLPMAVNFFFLEFAQK
jgi:hypothetical protein